MQLTRRKTLTVLGVALTLGLGLAALSRGSGGPNHGAGPRGGTLEMTKHYQFEVIFTTAGLKVYSYGMDGKPLNAAKLSGKATFYHPSTPKAWFDRPLSV